MKKTLLIGSALVIGFAGFSQSGAKRVITKKDIISPAAKRKIVKVEGSSDPNIAWHRIAETNSTSSGCSGPMKITTSWNPNGVGGSASCTGQNCLIYNSDLNALMWYQRSSKTWSLTTNSGGEQATIINHPAPSPTLGYPTNVLDSIITYNSSAADYVGRYPGGSWLNPAGNTNYHNAYACGVGPYVVGSNWDGIVYVAKKLSDPSAINHTLPGDDSLHVPGTGTGAIFGPCAVGTTQEGAPNCDMQQIGNMVMSTGYYLNANYSNASATQETHAFIFKGMLPTGTNTAVTWSVDSTSLKAAFYNDGLSGANSLGNQVAGEARMAFGPDGMHGYAVYIGRLAATANNSSDSCMTPIVFKTNDGGNTWTQVLQGYDWACKHPELSTNVGLVYANTKKDYWNFSNGFNGADVVVDKNNLLHFVCTMEATYIGAKPGVTTYSPDSVGFGYIYNFDNIAHHAIIWDCMTEGTGWVTMLVDSIQSGVCGTDPTTDTTANFSAWNAGSGSFLGVGAHLTVSRTKDGSKIFYGWADTPTGTNLFTDGTNSINPNTNPDIFLKGFDVNTNMVTPTTDINTGQGTCFFPYVADISYYDSLQSKWVVPTVYTTGASGSNVPPGFTQYDATSTCNYFYTNCGAFGQGDFSSPAHIYAPPAGSTCTSIGIKTYSNSFASSISNYPNPFNGATTISVTLTEQKPVNIKVYNTIGTLVFSKNIEGAAGTNDVTFDGGQLSSGVYYYTVTAGSQQATKKMVIQK